jgi:hypothetical protein
MEILRQVWTFAGSAPFHLNSMNAFAEVGIVSAAFFVSIFLAFTFTGLNAHLMDPGDNAG